MEFGHPGNEIFDLSYYEERTAIFECSHGHKNLLILQSQKFEVLMESGAEALLKGFTLEACATFYAALERTYEFAVRVFMLAKQVDSTSFISMFNEMARQSERQIGAFMALYLLETGKPYKVDTQLSAFRNSIIHKGEIPEPEKAREFCSRIYQRILEIISVLNERLPNFVAGVVYRDMEERRTRLEKDLHYSHTAVMFYNVMNLNPYSNFEEALSRFKNIKELRCDD